MAEKKWVYSFGDGKAEGAAEMRNLLGGKGANLAEMSNIGLPVPPGHRLGGSSSLGLPQRQAVLASVLGR